MVKQPRASGQVPPDATPEASALFVAGGLLCFVIVQVC